MPQGSLSLNLPVSVSEGSSREVGKAVSEETGTPNTAQNAKYGIWRAYLGGPNMVGWGIPEKIKQYAVQKG